MNHEDADVAKLLRINEGIYADDLVLAAIVRLDLLTVLAEEPITLDELCTRNGLARRPADVLCTLLRAMGLLETGEVLQPTELALNCLVQDAPMDLRPYLACSAARNTCIELLEVLRTGRPAIRAEDDETTRFERRDDPAFVEQARFAAHARARVLAGGLADALESLAVRSILDLAGSSEIVARDAFGTLPEGHDAHLLSHALHDWDEHRVRRILSWCFDALPQGGWVIDHDAHLNRDKTGPLSVARYSARLLYATEGKCWSVTEMTEFMAGTGFVNIEERSAGFDRTVIVGQKPE
ncbi:hypothetical protein BH20ACT23_BH20ACT23_22220 [soil metagenome]